MPQPRLQKVVLMAVSQGKARLSFGRSQTPGPRTAAPCMCLAPKANYFHSVPAVLMPPHSSAHVPSCPFPESHPEPEPLALGLISKYPTAPVILAALGRRPQAMPSMLKAILKASSFPFSCFDKITQPKSNSGEERVYFLQLARHTPSLREVRVGTVARNLKAGTAEEH